jgi:dihydrolipoamide dehydrogenase
MESPAEMGHVANVPTSPSTTPARSETPPPVSDILVIGGGPGGYAAAFRAADLGRSVTVVDSEPHLGGTCLLRGCIPSKALIAAAELAERLRTAGEMGIAAGTVQIDAPRLQAWKQQIVQQIGKGLSELAKRRRVRVIRGTARFLDRHAVAVSAAASGMEPATEQILRFEHAVVAVGSRPSFPPGLEPDGTHTLGSTEALLLDRVPPRLLVVGGGYIGLELGSCFRLLGSDVTVVEALPQLLTGTDPELVRPVARRLEQRGVRLRLATLVRELRVVGDQVEATIAGESGEPQVEWFDRVLVAAGRAANTESLNLAAAGVATDARNYLVTDLQGRTSIRHIFAAGDCAGGALLAHKARRDGVVAAEVIAGQASSCFQHAVPAVIFTDPEIAYCGLSEDQARAAGHEVVVGRFPFGALGRALIHRAKEGLVKIVTDGKRDEVLGVGIVGPGASELMGEAVLAVQARVRATELARTIHAHPTLAEGLQEAAEAVHGASLHIYKPTRTR